MKKKKILAFIYNFKVSLILLIIFCTNLSNTAKAFFEDQLRYQFVNQWYPMLSDSSPEKRFQAARAFLKYPEWSLNLLRNTIMNSGPENESWHVAMLIGIMGDSTDLPLLLKSWKEHGIDENSSIWLGAMRRLYWKNRAPNLINPVLKNLVVIFKENSAESEVEGKKVNLLFRIENPAKTPIFTRVLANFWFTLSDENIKSNYYWIPGGGFIESSIRTNITPASDAFKIRLDFRVWEVGLPAPILHHTRVIPFPGK